MIKRSLAAFIFVIMLNGCFDNAGGNTAGEGAAGGATGGDVTMVRDAKSGVPYGSAGPRSCPDRKVPVSGPLNPAQAAAYVICGREDEAANNLTLVGGITVTEVSPGRPYNYLQDNSVPDIDVQKPVYSIRGSMVVYTCNRVDTGPGWGPKYERGTNCRTTDHPGANGLCYQNGLGQWDCKLWDHKAKLGATEGLPPPA